MQKIELSVDTVNAILAYLSQRPYQESYKLIEAILKEGQGEKREGQADGLADSN